MTNASDHEAAGESSPSREAGMSFNKQNDATFRRTSPSQSYATASPMADEGDDGQSLGNSPSPRFHRTPSRKDANSSLKADDGDDDQTSPRFYRSSPSHSRTDAFQNADEGGNERVLADLTNLRIGDFKPTDEQSKHPKQDGEARQGPQGVHDDSDEVFYHEHKAVFEYFYAHVPVANELQELRAKGWSSTEGEEYFKKQKFHTDHADRKTSQNFMNMMRNVADKMQTATGVFTLPGPRPTILAFGFAPGGFVEHALYLNPTATATGITLGNKVCGIPILVKSDRLTFHPADITLMAADMGMLPDEIPSSHPDAAHFHTKLIRPRATFDLVTAEGGVLRPHQALLGAHREHREAHRLATAQLALSLARVKQGGRMVVLLHKPETYNSLSLFYTFSRFASIQLFKPSQEDGRAPHQYKSSFYMVAKDVQSQSEAARTAVKQWTKEWKAATFGTKEEYEEVVREHALDVGKVLEEFGEEWVRLGMEVWEIQRDGLKVKEFTKD